MFEKSILFKGMVRPALVSSVFFMALAGLAYPLVTTGLANLLFPAPSQGSLIERNGALVGSALIGQDFTRPEYFHPRPSATLGTDPADAGKTIGVPYNAAASGASNWGPTNRKLIDLVARRVAAYRAENGLAANVVVPVDAVTASGSGLDPDISVANAKIQARRVARYRNLPEGQVRQLVVDNTTGRFLGLIGDPRINVLKLNLALDALRPASAPGKF